MSYGVQSASLFGSTTSTDASSATSLRPFANLDLTEDQRKQIRSIFQSAKSQGLSQSEIQQEIEAILTPTQVTTLQSDLASQSASSDSSSSTSSAIQANSAPPPPPHRGNPFTDPNGPFANLNLTSDQQSQITQIFQNAKSEGLTFDQVNAQINAILTPSQQTTFASDLSNLPPPPGSQGGSDTSSDLLDDLQLTDDQKTKIDAILQSAQTSGTTQTNVLSQIESILTPAQQSAFLQDVQTAQATVSEQSQSSSGGTGSTPATTSTTGSSAFSESYIKNQIAAATSLILQQFQNEVK